MEHIDKILAKKKLFLILSAHLFFLCMAVIPPPFSSRLIFRSITVSSSLESESDELELELELSDELSEATPVSDFRFTLSATIASSGSLIWTNKQGIKMDINHCK